MAFKLNWPAFLIALFIGLTYVYFAAPAPREIIKFPNPQSADTDIYKDDAQECFRFKATRLESCPSNATSHPVSLLQ
jgi:hypothetical protein